MSIRLPHLTLAVLAIGSAACSRTQSQPKLPLAQVTSGGEATSTRDAMPEAARASLDLGNLEFRAGRYQQALDAYRSAAKSDTQNAAPYFGIFMAAQKLGNKPLADSASAQIAARNGSAQMLTDSSMQSLHAKTPSSKAK